jgi:hypothetical protein
LADARPSTPRARLRLTLLGAFLAAPFLAGCATTSYTPDIAGVVLRHESRADGTDFFVLADGRELTIDIDSQPIVYGAGLPSAGELLLAGDDPKPWVARLPDYGDCFWVGGRGREEGAFISTAVGLRLAKAADFDRAHYAAGDHEFNGGGFCVSPAGEVTAIR